MNALYSRISVTGDKFTKSRHYTELTVHDLLTNGSKVPPEAHFIAQGHAKQFNGILYRKRELVISFSQDHSLMDLQSYRYRCTTRWQYSIYEEYACLAPQGRYRSRTIARHLHKHSALQVLYGRTSHL